MENWTWAENKAGLIKSSPRHLKCCVLDCATGKIITSIPFFFPWKCHCKNRTVDLYKWAYQSPSVILHGPQLEGGPALSTRRLRRKHRVPGPRDVPENLTSFSECLGAFKRQAEYCNMPRLPEGGSCGAPLLEPRRGSPIGQNGAVGGSYKSRES